MGRLSEAKAIVSKTEQHPGGQGALLVVSGYGPLPLHPLAMGGSCSLKGYGPRISCACLGLKGHLDSRSVPGVQKPLLLWQKHP